MLRLSTRHLTATCLVALLALTGCSGDDEDAPEQDSGLTTPGQPQVEVPSQTPLPSVDASAQGELDAADVPAPSGLRLAEDLDTNAPVDSAALPSGLTTSQVQAMRRVWNERGIGVDAARGSDDPYCEAGEDGVWLGVTRVSGSEQYVLTLGVADDGDGTVTCTLDDALVVTDAETQDVLGDQQVALLL